MGTDHVGLEGKYLLSICFMLGASRISSREAFFTSILSMGCLRVRKIKLGSWEIVGFWSMNLLGFHGTLGYIWRVGIQGAIGRHPDQKLGASPISLLFLCCYHLEASPCHLSNLASCSSLLVLPGHSSQTEHTVGSQQLKGVTEESLMGVLSFAKKPNGTVKLLGQLGSKESWGYRRGHDRSCTLRRGTGHQRRNEQ